MAVEKSFGWFEKWVDCPECGGAGEIMENGVTMMCGYCQRADGQVPASKA